MTKRNGINARALGRFAWSEPGPGGTDENSPAFQRWVGCGRRVSPDGTAEIGRMRASCLTPGAHGATRPAWAFSGASVGRAVLCAPPLANRQRTDALQKL